MFKISKTYSFSASHQLHHLPEGHKCKRLHGHTYSVTVVLGAEKTDEDGFVTDFANLDSTVGAWLKDTFDHRHLNEVVAFLPTSELLAAFLFHKWKSVLPLVSVRVSESPTSWAEYSE